MSQGDLTLEQGLTTMLLGNGSGFMDLYFRQAGNEPQTVMTTWEIRAGFHCASCQMYIITNREGTQHTRAFREDTESECLSCHAPMAPGVATCPQCGWTYKDNSDT